MLGKKKVFKEGLSSFYLEKPNGVTDIFDFVQPFI